MTLVSRFDNERMGIGVAHQKRRREPGLGNLYSLNPACVAQSALGEKLDGNVAFLE